MTKPIVVQTTQETAGMPAGAELGYTSVDDAASILGEDAFTVVRYQDGSPLDADRAGANDQKPIGSMTRSELEAHATTLGIESPDDRDRFPNMDTLVDAIEAAQQGQGT